jgi:uncharacterized protein involved in exopolysaccharide biosynthesis
MEESQADPFKKLVELIKEEFKTIFSITFIFSLCGLIYALLATPIYKAELTMISNGDDLGSLSGLAALGSQFGILPSSDSQNMGIRDKKVAMAILTSREFILEYIDENDLMRVFFEDKWDLESNDWSVNKESIPTYEHALKLVRDNSLIEEDVMTGILKYSFEWTDANLAAKWVNDTVKEVNNKIRVMAIQEAEMSEQFLKKELKKTSQVGPKEVLFSLIEEQIKTVMIANTREEYAFKVIDPALVPIQRIKPKRKMIAVTSFSFGIFLSFLYLIIRRSYFPREIS